MAQIPLQLLLTSASMINKAVRLCCAAAGAQELGHRQHAEEVSSGGARRIGLLGFYSFDGTIICPRQNRGTHCDWLFKLLKTGLANTGQCRAFKQM
jgi:hypothetical protein